MNSLLFVSFACAKLSAVMRGCSTLKYIWYRTNFLLVNFTNNYNERTH